MSVLNQRAKTGVKAWDLHVVDLSSILAQHMVSQALLIVSDLRVQSLESTLGAWTGLNVAPKQSKMPQVDHFWTLLSGWPFLPWWSLMPHRVFMGLCCHHWLLSSLFRCHILMVAHVLIMLGFFKSLCFENIFLRNLLVRFIVSQKCL